MAGRSRPKDGVASLAIAVPRTASLRSPMVPAIHVFGPTKKVSRGCPGQGRAWRGERRATHFKRRARSQRCFRTSLDLASRL